MRVEKRYCDFCGKEEVNKIGQRVFLYLWAATYTPLHGSLDSCPECADSLTVRDVERKAKQIDARQRGLGHLSKR